MNIEQKRFRAEIKAAKENGEFEAVIATLNVVDSDGDIIASGAFGKGVASVVPAHDHSSVPLGKARIEERGNLAVAVGKFNLDIPAAKDWHNALKFDLADPPAVQEWSFAFRTLDSEHETRDGEPIRILKSMDVMEYSPVLRGAGVGTGTLSAKGTFEEQLDKVVSDVGDVIARAAQIAKMRAGKQKPKALSDERKAALTALEEKFSQLRLLLKECDARAQGDDSPEPDEHDPEGMIDAEMLASEVQQLGVDIPE